MSAWSTRDMRRWRRMPKGGNSKVWKYKPEECKPGICPKCGKKHKQKCCVFLCPQCYAGFLEWKKKNAEAQNPTE